MSQGGPVEQVPGGEVVHGIHDQVAALQQPVDAVFIYCLHQCLDFDLRIYALQSLSGRIGLVPAHVIAPVQHLPVEVARLDTVAVRDAYLAEAGCRHVDGYDGPESARSGHKDACTLELLLAGLAEEADLAGIS